MIEPIYIINSHKDYGHPLGMLLKSMSGIPDSRKLVFVAGCAERRTYVEAGIVYHEVAHNSFDYTGLIELVERPSLNGGSRTHFFCLQDTMLCGSMTDSLIGASDPDKLATAAFGGQCNLVLYKGTYLANKRELILSMRNCSKLRSIEMEGALWKNCPEPNRASFEDSHIEVKPSRTAPVYDGVPRIYEYYAGVDVVKWKSNWGQNMQAMTTAP